MCQVSTAAPESAAAAGVDRSPVSFHRSPRNTICGRAGGSELGIGRQTAASTFVRARF